MTRLLLASLLLAGCLDPVTTNTVTRGTPECLDGDRLRVRFDTCLSSSCDTLRSASCTVTVDGDRATVTGSAEIEHRGFTCTADCGFVEATCEGELEEAALVRFGNTTKERSALTACP